MPPSRMTDLRDDDAIHGGEKKLLEALKAGLENAEGLEAVVVHSTCVPTVIGDDVPKTMRAAAAGVSVPLIFSNPAGNQTVDVSRFILEKVLS
ncbi:MAG: nitrogenase component 1, partial [Elusimicrobiota bacterium]